MILINNKNLIKKAIITLGMLGAAYTVPMGIDQVRNDVAINNIRNRYEVSAIKEEYILSGSVLKTITNNKDDIKIEIGEDNSDIFIPSFKISRWDNEVWLKIKPKIEKNTNLLGVTNDDLEFIDNKIIYKNGEREFRFYKIDKNNISGANINVNNYPILDNINTIRYIKRDIISPTEMAAGYELPVYLNYNQAILRRYIGSEGFVFFGNEYASDDLRNVKNLPIPIIRYNTEELKRCPVILSDNGVALEFYHPSVRYNQNYFLNLMFSAIKEELKINGFNKNVHKKSSYIYYFDGLVAKQLGRISADGSHIIFYLYIDKPNDNYIKNYYRFDNKFMDSFLTRLSGLKEVNSEMDETIVDKIAINFANKVGGSLVESNWTKKELQTINSLNFRLSSPKWKLFGNVEKIKKFNKKVDDKNDANTYKYEFETILYKKPSSNIIVYDIETNGLDFYYQPPLNIEMNDPTCTPTDCRGYHRPENVVGSYAVYHKTKKNDYSKSGGKNYYSGKAFHIYRPKIIDDNGSWVWGELNIDKNNNRLEVIVPQSFLDTAKYPIIIDPTFGYSACGASYTVTETEDQIVGSVFTGAAGTVDSISACMASNQSDDYFKMAIYVHSDSSLLSNSGTAELYCGTSKSFKTHTYTTKPNISAVDYVLVAWGPKGDSCISFYYDSGATNQGHLDSETYGSWPDPATFSHNNNKYSIYVTYTETGGGTPSEKKIPSVITFE